MTDEKKATRRRYGAQFKAQVLAECELPGASVAKVAMAHGINDNVVHNWRKLAREGGCKPAARANEFVPVTVAPVDSLGADLRSIEVEVHRGALTMRIAWPMSAATDFAAWTRELLR